MTFLLSILLATTLLEKPAVPRVSVEELRTMMEKGEAIAVDVRGSVPHALGRIAGDTWMPIGLMKQRSGELPQDKLLVLYCTCKTEELSLQAAVVLANQYGFERVAVLKGGYTAWKDAGYPIAADEDPDAAPAPAPAPAATPMAEPAGRPAAAGGRLAPPAAVPCDRNNLTSFAGRVTAYRREAKTSTLVIRTSAGTTEKVVVPHASDDHSKEYLLENQPFTSADWKRIMKGPEDLRDDVSVIAWVCTDGRAIIDWRPGVTFTGAE